MLQFKKYRIQLALVTSLLLPTAALWSAKSHSIVQNLSPHCTTYDTISDDAGPVALDVACKDITVEVKAGRSVTIKPEQIADFSLAVHDSISLSIQETRTTFGCADAGEQMLTLKATSSDGQQHSCVAKVIVEDHTPAPTATCKDITVQLDLLGTARIFPSDIDNSDSYPCGYSSLSLDREQFSCADMGQENIVTLKAASQYGQASSCQAKVTVVDHLKPTLTCPEDIMVNTDQEAMGAPINLAKALSIDNCGLTDLKSRYRPLDRVGRPVKAWSDWAADHSGFYPVGSYEIQWRASDRSGNQAHGSTRLYLSPLTQ